MTGCGIMSSVWDMILQGGSTIKVNTELPVATRHRRDMTEKLLKTTLNPNTHTHTHTHTRFNPNVDENSDISAKSGAGKYLHAVFLLTVEQRNDIMTSPTSNQIVESHGLF